MYRDSIPDTAQDDRYTGFRILWLKVIQRAVYDYASYRDSSKLDKRKLADTAEFWMFKPSACFNSFDNICSLLGLDADDIRRRSKSMTRAEVETLQKLEEAGLLGKVEIVHRGGAVCYVPLPKAQEDEYEVA